MAYSRQEAITFIFEAIANVTRFSLPRGAMAKEATFSFFAGSTCRLAMRSLALDVPKKEELACSAAHSPEASERPNLGPFFKEIFDIDLARARLHRFSFDVR